MKIRNFFPTILVVLFISCIQQSIAQPTFSISTSNGYNSNPFNLPVESGSFINSLEMGIEYDYKNFGIGYYTDYTLFQSISERNFFWHQAGGWYSTENTLFGVYSEQRINKSDYDYFDYTFFNTYLNYKGESNSVYYLFNSSVSYTSYDELPELNNLLINFRLRTSKSFDTKTTLIFGGTFNNKHYSNSEILTFNPRGRRTGGFVQSSATSISQLNLYGRISQSVWENFGIAAQYTYKNILSGTGKDLSNLNLAYNDESQIFDDPVSNEGYSFNFQITQILPYQVKLQGNYYFNSKLYPAQGIYLDKENFDESVMREDKQEIIMVSAAKTFDLSWSSISQFTFMLQYSNTVNNSNSYWYNYMNNSVSLTLKLDF